jgi:hypothetical protein
MELIIVSGIQVLALMLVQAADYLAQRRPKQDASPRRAGKVQRQPAVEPTPLEQFDAAA